MIFSVHATHYSTVAGTSLELKSSKSQPSVKHTGSIRCKMSRIFKKLLSNDTHTDDRIKNEIKEHTQLCEGDILPCKTMNKNIDKTKTKTLENSNNDKNNDPIKTVSDPSKTILPSSQPIERLPFTEPYFSITPTDEKSPIELSAYHKHCIHQEKFIDQKQYLNDILTKTETKISQLNSSISTPANEKFSDLLNHQVENSKEKIANQTRVYDNKTTKSTTTLPMSTSIENRIGFEYASRRKVMTNSHNVRSSYAPQYLRRLHSKPKVRSFLTEAKTLSLTSQNECFPSSSIAHRIELLKQAMHNNQFKFHHSKFDKISPIQLPSHPSIDTLNKETQTNDNHVNSSEFHHIHYHHIHSPSFLPIEWRTFFSILGTVSIIFLLYMELITLIF